jgi:hypothetical protein
VICNGDSCHLWNRGLQAAEWAIGKGSDDDDNLYIQVESDVKCIVNGLMDCFGLKMLIYIYTQAKSKVLGILEKIGQ